MITPDQQERVEHFDVVCEDCGSVVSDDFAEYTGDSEEAQWSCLVCNATLADMIELKRFREREPDLQNLLYDLATFTTEKTYTSTDDDLAEMKAAAQALRTVKP